MKKILYYNWVPFDDCLNRGGGVTIYQRNVINALKDNENYSLYFLSAGMYYNFKGKNPYVVQTKNNLNERCKSFRIINSPILAPSYFQFQDVDAYFSDETLYHLLKEFVQKEGPFDAIHFNNLEGLSSNVLKIKEDFPDTKLIYSLHNYFAFCPQVGLWWHDRHTCTDEDYDNGNGCTDCSIYVERSREKLNGLGEHLMTSMGFRPGTRMQEIVSKGFRGLWRIKKKTIGRNTAGQYISNRESYVNFREKNVEYINKYVDCVIAVSERVREIAIRMGVQSDKVKTLYIGTTFAANQKEGKVWNAQEPYLNMVYLGYPRSDKGFFFLMDSLEKADEKTAGRINLTFATKTDDKNIIDRINRLSGKFHEVRWRNGYTHGDLSEILENQDLGVVPVLWEDNLPQVAIEMVANGVPVLSADLGGAKELSDAEAFVFQHGDADDFIEKLRDILDGRTHMSAYWDGYKGLVTMERHIKELEDCYQS